MAKSKKSKSSRPSVKVRDLKAKKNPKGGAVNAYLNFDSQTIGSTPTSSSKITDVSSLNFKK